MHVKWLETNKKRQTQCFSQHLGPKYDLCKLQHNPRFQHYGSKSLGKMMLFIQLQAKGFSLNAYSSV